ncbi:MAG: hypothetical protein ABR526_06085 [Chthoniobacterales bacterium]
MADEQVDIAAFRAIRDQYAAEVEKADRDLEKAKDKLAHAKNRLQVANEMIAQATGGKEGTHKPLSEEVLRVINEANGAGLTAKDIRDKFMAEGFHFELAAIHVNADRLKKKGAIELLQGPDPRTKLFRSITVNQMNTA